MVRRVNPNGPMRSRTLLPAAMLGLGLLAAMAGQASAELGCKQLMTGTSDQTSYLSDTENCHTTDLNAAFDGRLTHCDSAGRVRRICSQACTHHHTHTHTHKLTHTQRGQSVRQNNVHLPLYNCKVRFIEKRKLLWNNIISSPNINTTVASSLFFLSFFFGWCGTARLCGCGCGWAWVLGGLAWLVGLVGLDAVFRNLFLLLISITHVSVRTAQRQETTSTRMSDT